MNILFLGYKDLKIIDFLKKNNHYILHYDEKINPTTIIDHEIEFVISFGYRYILPADIIKLLPNRIINLHISYLPFNRGADPNFWSFIEDTPKGVTIHLIDEGIDTGDILVQKEIRLSDNDTLRNTYSLLIDAIQQLFLDSWQDILNNKIIPKKQTEKGSYHNSKDKRKYIDKLGANWLDIPIWCVMDKILCLELNDSFYEQYVSEIKRVFH